MGRDVMGSDISSAMVGLARQNVAESKIGREFAVRIEIADGCRLGRGLRFFVGRRV
jgi:tRNA G10  N-methylase Trm11